MKDPRYYFGFIVGYLKGWIGGAIEGRRLLKIIKQHGDLADVPTRDLMNIGMCGPLMVRRQQMLVGTYILSHLLKTYTQQEIPRTNVLVAAWATQQPLDPAMAATLERLSYSTSVIHSLTDLAIELDGIDKEQLVEAMITKNKGYVWEQLRSNDILRVT